MREIIFNLFNRPIDKVMWPDCLEVLSFHSPSRTFRTEQFESEDMGIFNMPLDRVTFPAGLREIFLGSKFNQPITGVAWPERLELLSMPGFNQPILDVRWPSGLKTLEFVKPYHFEHRQSLEPIPSGRQNGSFNQPLGKFLPTSLETLWLSDAFDQPLHGVTWPSKLAVLGLGTEISPESVDGVAWPPSLRKVVYSEEMLCIRNAPPGCEVVSYNPLGFSGSDQDDEHSEDQWDIDNYEQYADHDYDNFDCDEGDYDNYHSPGGLFCM